MDGTLAERMSPEQSRTLRNYFSVKGDAGVAGQWHQIEMLIEQNVAGNLGDNVDSWKKMRFYHYGNDELLRLCDPGRRVKFSHHMLCAHLYQVEIEELLSVTEIGASSRTVMEAHIQLLHNE